MCVEYHTIWPSWSTRTPPPACLGSSSLRFALAPFGLRSRGFRLSGLGPFVAAVFFPNSSTLWRVVKRARPSAPIAVAQTNASHDHWWKEQSWALTLAVSLVGNGGAG